MTKYNLLFIFMQSVLGKMNEIAKHKTAIEDADTQNKVGTPLRFQRIIFYYTTLPELFEKWASRNPGTGCF